MEILKLSSVAPAQGRTERPPVPAKERPVPEAAQAQKASSPTREAKAEANRQEDLRQAARDLELRFNVKVELGTDEETGRKVVRIFSQDGKRLLRQMPPDETLQMAARARDGSLRNLLTSLA